MDFNNLTEDDKLKLEKLVRHSSTLEKIAKYEEAKVLVAGYWKTLVVSLAATLVAVALLWDKFKHVVKLAVEE